MKRKALVLVLLAILAYFAVTHQKEIRANLNAPNLVNFGQVVGEEIKTTLTSLGIDLSHLQAIPTILPKELVSPISYTALFQERGLHLSVPTSSDQQADLQFRIAGSIDPKNRYAKQTDHLIIQTVKGQDTATYFIPVQNNHFDSSIWLRFGGGDYQVTLFVPEITNEHHNYFRFYSVASFQVKSTAKQDLRDHLPSRGVQSDDPKIIALAHQLTASKETTRSKAYAIYRYVAQTMRYDVRKAEEDGFEWDDSALKSLRTHTGVCQDYAYLNIALLRAADIPARFIEGQAGGQRHAWVEAWIDNRWVTMDPTWGSGFVLTPSDKFVKKYDLSFFDPLPSSFERTHHRTGVVY